MQIPVIGRYITDYLEGKLDMKMAKCCCRRPETASNRDWKYTQGRFGGSNVVMDLQKFNEWTNIPPRYST